MIIKAGRKERVESELSSEIGNVFALPGLAFNAVTELGLNKYSCSMLKRRRELVHIASN